MQPHVEWLVRTAAGFAELFVLRVKIFIFVSSVRYAWVDWIIMTGWRLDSPKTRMFPSGSLAHTLSLPASNDRHFSVP